MHFIVGFPCMDVYHGMYNDDVAMNEDDDTGMDECTESLFAAIRKNIFDEALGLVEEHADVNCASRTSVRPLYIAMENQNLLMVRMLLDHGADVNLSSYCHLYCTYEMPVVTAARLQNRELLELILSKQCEMEGSLSFREGKTALQWASSHGNIPMAETLLQHGADVNWIGMYCHTALHYAAIADKPTMVSWLLDNGAENNINGDGRTPLHIAAVRGNEDIVRCLVDRRAHVDNKDSFQFTPMSLACLRGHFNIAKFLMDNTPEGVEHDLSECLRKASESGHVAVVKYLLSNGADVNEANPLGETALGLSSKGQDKTTLILLEDGANINVVDNRGYTPLQHALMRDQREISANLIRHGATLHTNNLHTESPLQIAFNMSNPILVKYILQAGCLLSREPWFTPFATRQKIQELDFQVSALMRFHPESNISKETWEWVEQTFGKTRTLVQWARIAIRSQIITATNGSSILKRIEKLPLPSPLINYLSFSAIYREH